LKEDCEGGGAKEQMGNQNAKKKRSEISREILQTNVGKEGMATC